MIASMAPDECKRRQLGVAAASQQRKGAMSLTGQYRSRAAAHCRGNVDGVVGRVSEAFGGTAAPNATSSPATNTGMAHHCI